MWYRDETDSLRLKPRLNEYESWQSHCYGVLRGTHPRPQADGDISSNLVPRVPVFKGSGYEVAFQALESRLTK